MAAAIALMTNRRLVFRLIAGHLLWSCALLGLWATGRLMEAPGLWWAALFLALQLYAAGQLILPVLLLHPFDRTRGFYFFWGLVLALSIWLINQVPPGEAWAPLLTVIKSALLLLVATLTGTVLARHITRLWEILPICLVMTLADLVSFFHGPTAGFAREIEQYYRVPEGPPPLIDMVLVKLVFPGSVGLAPVFGISDWIMVVFFAVVARRHGVNDNLFGAPGETLVRKGRIGAYLPVSVAALFAGTVLAQATGLFIPALPLIALIVLLWYAGRFLLRRRAGQKKGLNPL
jgi:hypothetical protein